jgi:acetoin utilization deacetylase AcuC-like enzyme
VTILLETHASYLCHDTGPGHPERPARLEAVLQGIDGAGMGDAVVAVSPRPATEAELEVAHAPEFVQALKRFCLTGGGHLDPDTSASPESWDAALLAAGAGLDAVERLSRGEATAAFCAVRPPGHHATPRRAMGFCLLNNVAVTGAALAGRGERVAIVDWDAHHGNGTQDCFYADPRVLYASMHEFPLYPGTGRLDETGAGEGIGSTVNLPFPAGTTGDVYLLAVDDLTRRLAPLVAPGRVVAFLEGGYDLEALARSAGACVAALGGCDYRPEPATAGGAGRAVVEAALRLRSA